jgi:hypothetical protein
VTGAAEIEVEVPDSPPSLTPEAAAVLDRILRAAADRAAADRAAADHRRRAS